MQIIDAGIVNSFLTLMKLCGYIVMFSITADIIRQFRFLPGQVRYLLIGLTEVTCGLGQLQGAPYSDAVKLLLAVLFLSLGGLSGAAQTGACLAPGGLSLKKYLRSKLLYTCCSIGCCLCLLLLGIVPV
jgi:hypothetical protein